MRTKLTRSQQKVLDLFQNLAEPISAQGIYLELRNRQENLGIATVYRSLETLKVQGAIKSQMSATGESLYSLIPTDHHHLNCLQCGLTLPIHACPIDNMPSHTMPSDTDLEHSGNFKVFYHTLEFFGLCGDCQQA
jgi:Fur family transcriptional regulator, ferric uptake regulator